MKILLVTFDKEMDKKIRELLKDYQIVTVKNGEEALLLNMGEDIGLIIYDALAGGIAEEDINKLYEEGFKDVPYIILMDDLFPIDPANIKPKIKKVISREVEVDRLPEIVKEMLSKSPKKKEETVEWEQMFGTPTVEPKKEETAPAQPEVQPSQPPAEQPAAQQPPAAPAEEKPAAPTEEKPAAPKKPAQEILAAHAAEPTVEVPTKKQCLLVSFDMPLVEKIEAKIKDLCDLYVARSSKQALQKYKGKDFDVIIFDTISGVFAEKGIRDLYEKGGYKDALYVVLLDEFMPIDIDKLPVKNMRAIKRESEIDLLPEIIENAPHITLEKALQQASATVTEEQPAAAPAEEKKEEAAPSETVAQLEQLLKETGTEKTEEKPAEAQPAAEQPKAEEKPATQPSAQPQPAAPAQPTTPPPQATAPAPQAAGAPQPAAAQPQVAVSEELIERIVEQKIQQMVIPLIEEIVKSKLSDFYIRGIVEEVIKDELSDAEIREIVQEIAEPLVKEILEQLLS